MPKLDLRNARRIKTASGELAALKGSGFDWVKPFTGVLTYPNGDELVLVFGDSNSNGMFVTYPEADPDNTRYQREPTMTNDSGIRQFTGPDATAAGVAAGILTSDFTPTYGQNGDPNVDRIGIAECVARQLKRKLPTNRNVVVSQMGKGGANIFNAGTQTVSSAGIGVGGARYEAAIAQFVAAVNAARQENPSARVSLIVYAGPSNDSLRNAAPFIDQTAMTAALSAIVDDTRARVPGAAEAAFAFMGIMPSITTGSSTAVRNALIATASAKARAQVFVPAGIGANDGLHPVPLDLEGVAEDIADWWVTQSQPQRPRAFSIPNQAGVALDTEITSESIPVPMNGSGVTGTVTVTGGGVSINGGGFVATPQIAQWTDTMRVRRRSSAQGSTSASATVRVTGPNGHFEEATFTVTTVGVGTNRLVFGSADALITNGGVVFGSAPGIKEAA